MNSDTDASTPGARTAMRWLERKIVYSVGFGVIAMLAIGA